LCFLHELLMSFLKQYTRKYMHAEIPRLADKTIVFSEHEVFKVVDMVTR
jgi:hypothetical protein